MRMWIYHSIHIDQNDDDDDDDDDGLGVQASVLRWHCQGCQPLPGRPSPASAGFHPTTNRSASSTRVLGSLAGSCLFRSLASKWQIFLSPGFQCGCINKSDTGRLSSPTVNLFTIT